MNSEQPTDIQRLAQVAAEFSETDVIYEWAQGSSAPKIASPAAQVASMWRGTLLRLDIPGVQRDRLIAAVKRGMSRCGCEYAECSIDGGFQVTVWRSSSPSDQHTSRDERLDIALLRALAKLI